MVAVLVVPVLVGVLVVGTLTGRTRGRVLQPALDALGDLEVGEQLRGVGVGLLDLGDAEVESLVDDPPPGDVGPVDQGDGDALGAGATCAANPVHVGHLGIGAFVVDHVADFGDVDATGRDVGRDQHVHLAVAELLEGLLAGHLVQVTVDRRGREATVLQFVGQPLGRPLRTGEDHGPGAHRRLQEASDDLGLVQVVGLVDELLRVGDGELSIVGLRAHVHRLVQVHAGERDDRCGHRGREQQGLARLGRLGDEALHVGQEPEVEHLVGLVQHEHLHLGKVEGATVREVEQATRGADDNVDALGEGLELGLVADAAVDGEDAGLADGGGHVEVTGDLQGQFARRGHHQCLREALEGHVGVALVGRDEDPLQQRDAEGEGLAGAGTGLPDHVGAADGDRDGEALDRERMLDADRGQRLDDLGNDTEVLEGEIRDGGGNGLGD